MEVTRVTVDEIKQRMDRGEAFTFIDTRNPRRGPQPRPNFQEQFAFSRTKWNSTSTKFPTIAQSSLTVRDRMKHPAPVWRRH